MRRNLMYMLQTLTSTAISKGPIKNCILCRLNGISVNSFRRNYSGTLQVSARVVGPRIVAEDLDFKSKLVSSLNLKRTEEALPFLKLPTKTLIHLSKVTKDDERKGYCKNRLYYLAQRLNVDPIEISEYVANRTFIYTLSFEWLQSSLDVLIEFGISTDRILRDLWVLKYHHLTIRERLQSVRAMGIEVLCPWMVRCSHDILNRFITITQDAKTILGDVKSTQIYLANRLNTTPEALDDLFGKLPALRTIRATKLKIFLDFLFQEGFTAEEILTKMRILTASQKTVEQRLQKLRKLGLNEINLNVLCRSRKAFSKYCNSIDQGSMSDSSTSRKDEKKNSLYSVDKTRVGTNTK